MTLYLRAPIVSVFRTKRKIREISSIAEELLNAFNESPVSKGFTEYVYITTHHFHPKLVEYNWKKIKPYLLSEIEKENRFGISIMRKRLYGHYGINLNCIDEVVEEVIDGKKRKVPKPSETSAVSIGIEAESFLDSEFFQDFVKLGNAVFSIIHGNYGRAVHPAVKQGNDYDRIHRDFFDPSFISWANWFGPELVDEIGSKKILTAPFHTIEELKGGGMMFTISENPLQQDEPDVIEKAEKIRKHLGILTPSERDGPEKVNEFNRKLKAHEEETKWRIETAFRTAKEETAKEMSRQAEGCREGGKKFWNVELDYSQKSIKTLDQILEKSLDKDDEEAVETAIQAFGAYLGETIRKMNGGAWRDEEMNNQPVLMDVGKRKDRINPFDLVRKKLEKGDAFSIAEWYQNTLLK